MSFRFCTAGTPIGRRDILDGEDIRKVHGYLGKKGIRMAIWGDYLLECVRRGYSQQRGYPENDQ